MSDEVLYRPEDYGTHVVTLEDGSAVLIKVAGGTITMTPKEFEQFVAECVAARSKLWRIV